MRLSDIAVDEVSLVDKAANKRKFAFIKRDNTEIHNAIDKEMEIVEAQRILKANLIPTENDEPTSEEVEALVKLSSELTELSAQVTKKA